jgi:hypothetical protein
MDAEELITALLKLLKVPVPTLTRRALTLRYQWFIYSYISLQILEKDAATLFISRTLRKPDIQKRPYVVANLLHCAEYMQKGSPEF